MPPDPTASKDDGDQRTRLLGSSVPASSPADAPITRAKNLEEGATVPPEPTAKNDNGAQSAKSPESSKPAFAAADSSNTKAKGIRKTLLRFVRSIPVMISIGSLCVALAGYIILRQSTLRQTREAEEATRLVWIGSIEDQNTLVLSPANQDIRIVDARLFVSNGIPTGYSLPHQKFRMPLDKPAAEVRRIIETEWELYPNSELRQVSKAPDWIPVMIDSTYVVRGVQHYDRALYRLDFSYVIDWGPDNKIVFTVSFGGFTLFANVDGDGETYGFLKRSWEKRVRDFLEHAGPPTPNRVPFEVKFGEIPDIPAGQIVGPWRRTHPPGDKP